ncbi:MAG: C-type lectin domain-containing protein, partial [Verrucomicrobiota bacterium]
MEAIEYPLVSTLAPWIGSRLNRRMFSSKALLSTIAALAFFGPFGVFAQAPPPGVPKEAKHLEGHWFLPVVVSELGIGKDSMTWREAQEYAERIGGNLASL